MSDAHETRFGPIRFIGGDNGGSYPACNSLYIDPARLLIDPGSNQENQEDPAESSAHWA